METNDQDEKILIDYPNPLFMEETKIILKQMKSSVAKILYKSFYI